ncbi:MAG: DUF7266 family protein [Thermoplasmatota archaeon]
MDSESAVSEVFSAILAFSITAFIVFVSLLVFDNANDQAERVSAAAEGVAIAETLDNALMDFVPLLDNPNVERYEFHLQLPRTVQGNPYSVAMDQDTFYLNVTNLGIVVVYPLRVADGTGLIPCNSSAEPQYARLVYEREPNPPPVPAHCHLSLT